MALSIKFDEADQQARELADLTGGSIAESVTKANAARLDRERRVRQPRRSALDLAHRFQRLATLDARTEDEILGYDDDGLPT